MSKLKIFILLNAVIYILLPFWTYQTRGVDIVDRVAFISIIIVVSFVIYWKLGRLEISWPILIALQVGVIMHFTGGMILNGTRVYDLQLGLIRYDKLVHFWNALVGFFFWRLAFKQWKIDLGKMEIPILILVVLGCGAVLEIAEYIGLFFVKPLAIKQDLYNNNMQDLVANLLGGFTAAIVEKVKGKFN
jgi:hypothetical protein